MRLTGRQKERSLAVETEGQDPDDTWVDRLRGGDQDAFTEFIDRYKETVFLCCRRLGLREDEVEDVASETFMAAYSGIQRYRGRAELSTWIWSIAYRRSVSFLRKNRREMRLEAEVEEQIDGGREEGPAAALQRKEQDELIWQAVEQLPRLWAMAVVLFYREDKAVAEIARIMNTKENTVKTYLFRGRDRLREMLALPLGEQTDEREPTR